MRSRLQTHEASFFEYDTHIPCSANINQCQNMTIGLQPDAIIGHSLGGIIAAHLSSDAKRVTVASPFGGSAIANWLPMYSQLMRDVATTSPIISALRSKKVDHARFLSIVANGLDGRGFDGVISTTSQKALYGPDYRTFDLNHFEVLVDDEIIDLIDQWL
jgi:hypothetical protein